MLFTGPNWRFSRFSAHNGNFSKLRPVRLGLSRQPASPVSAVHVGSVGEPWEFPRVGGSRLGLWQGSGGAIAFKRRLSVASLCSGFFNIRVGSRETGSRLLRDRFVQRLASGSINVLRVGLADD